jgi:DNA-binding NarL/FixJ family response regulator
MLLQRAFSTGREQTTEFAVSTLEGERHFQTRIVPEFAPDGSVHSVLSISRDVTDQRVAEAERTEVHREMVEQQRRLTELISRMDPHSDGAATQPADADQIDHLTVRQRAVLRLVIKGWTNREIAAELNLSKGTVKNHIEQILTKLDVTDRTQAAVRAVELGIVVPR